jgi:uncharacterized tellurite resistance protein B-like protein
MAQNQMILNLARVMIAAAWADGELQHEEINSLKDLLFHIPSLDARSWASLEIYMQSPVSEQERLRLIDSLKSSIKTRDERKLALEAIESVVHADGQLSESEAEMVAELSDAISSVGVGLIGLLGRGMRAPLQILKENNRSLHNREQFIDDFIRNKVYYSLRERLGSSSTEVQHSSDELWKFCLAGGLMARIAHIDNEISGVEAARIARLLETGWTSDPGSAELIAQVAVSEIASGLDQFRLVREFFQVTTEDERVRFLDILFQVADADDNVLHTEIEEIRKISTGLKLTHQQFIRAKIKIPSERRES